MTLVEWDLDRAAGPRGEAARRDPPDDPLRRFLAISITSLTTAEAVGSIPAPAPRQGEPTKSLSRRRVVRTVDGGEEVVRGIIWDGPGPRSRSFLLRDREQLIVYPNSFAKAMSAARFPIPPRESP